MHAGVAALAAAALALPHGWPHHLAVGVSDSPGDAAAVRGLDFRYQYLAGGVNTGSGWSTWNPGGSFVTLYVRESRAAGIVPVFTYYQLLQSRADACGGGEDEADLCRLRDAGVMRAYWDDLRLALRRMRGSRPVVLHVEPDLWGTSSRRGSGRWRRGSPAGSWRCATVTRATSCSPTMTRCGGRRRTRRSRSRRSRTCAR